MSSAKALTVERTTMNEEKPNESNELDDNLVIDHTNFDQYFFDVKKFGPKHGQVMARYLANAELIAGDEKGYLIDLLITNPMGAEMGVQIARNAFAAQEKEAIRLCKEMAQDLLNGMSRQQVLEKPYKYTLEKFYWTRENLVPKNDPHWTVIKVTILKEPEKNEEEE
jgi:hypothetical protein